MQESLPQCLSTSLFGDMLQMQIFLSVETLRFQFGDGTWGPGLLRGSTLGNASAHLLPRLSKGPDLQHLTVSVVYSLCIAS